MSDHPAVAVQYEAHAAGCPVSNLLCDLFYAAQGNIERDNAASVGELLCHGRENGPRLLIKVRTHKGDMVDLIAAVSYRLRIPRTFCRNVIIIRHPAYSVEILPVDPSVDTGVVRVDGYFDAFRLRGKVFEYLLIRPAFVYHPVHYMGGEDHGILSHDKVVIEFLCRLHGIHPSLQMDALLGGPVQLIAANARDRDSEQKNRHKRGNASAAHTPDDIFCLYTVLHDVLSRDLFAVHVPRPDIFFCTGIAEPFDFLLRRKLHCSI